MRPIIALALLAMAAPVGAQETIGLPEDYVPPAAELSQMDWLVGRWHGSGIDGHAASESWLPPMGDTMIGTFVQAGPSGNIMFSEHMYLQQREGSLVLLVKHFNHDFTAWEDRDGMVTFRLVDLEPCRARFGGLTLRCEGENGLVIAVRMRSSAGDVNELLFDFTRAD